MTTPLVRPGMEEAAALTFTGRIDRRLSVVFGTLFALVLLVGGVSLFLLGSLLLRSEEVAQESEQVHLEERMHRLVQDVFFSVQDARARGATLSEAAARAQVAELESVLALYRRAGGSETNAREMQGIVTSVARLASRTAGRADQAASRGQLDAGSLELLDVTRRSIQALTDRMSRTHADGEQRQIRETHRKLEVTLAVNVAFVVVGTFLLLASHRYFRRAIAVPLRRLTERAAEIAEGRLDRAVPVTSSDEIGRLSHAFNSMAEQLRQHEETVRGMVTLEERERLARELHDDLAQDLAFLRLKLIEVERGLAASPDAEGMRTVGEMLGIVDRAYQNLRTAIFGLRALDVKASGGLVPALADYLDDFRGIRKIRVALRVSEPDAFVFAPQTEAQLVRIIHEALTNVVKHAQASQASVTLQARGDTATITVEDDGVGFVPDKVSDDGSHFGLRTMRDRAEAVHGTLAIDSAPGQGTRVIVRVPLARV